jgi:hypothetical protein
MVSAMAVLWAFVIPAVNVEAATESPGSHDGSFASTRRGFSTTLHVLEGADEALVYYVGGFGPGCSDDAKGGWCRSCDLGPVLAPREASGGFLLVSDAGKARLVVQDRAWQLRLVEGVADWCGAGWSGDAFASSGTRPLPCVVVTQDAALMQTGDDAGARHTGAVTRGQRVVALDALPSEEPQLLVRSERAVGVMWRKDLSCPSR